MFKDMRRKDRELTQVDIIRILNEGEYGFLAIAGSGDYPYCLPISYVYLNNSIFIHSAKEGHKIERLNENNKVCFSIVGQTKILPGKFSTVYESVILFGTMVEVSDMEKRTALEGIIDKYSPEYKNEGLTYIDRAKDNTRVYKIIIENITGKGRKA